MCLEIFLRYLTVCSPLPFLSVEAHKSSLSWANNKNKKKLPFKKSTVISPSYLLSAFIKVGTKPQNVIPSLHFLFLKGC